MEPKNTNKSNKHGRFHMCECGKFFVRKTNMIRHKDSYCKFLELVYCDVCNINVKSLEVHSKSKRHQQQINTMHIPKTLYVLSIIGDGNCCFRSMSHAMFGTQDHHAALRHFSAEGQGLSLHHSLRKLGTWAGSQEVLTIMELFDCPISVTTKTNSESEAVVVVNPTASFVARTNRMQVCMLQFLDVGHSQHYQVICDKEQQPSFYRFSGIIGRSLEKLYTRNGLVRYLEMRDRMDASIREWLGKATIKSRLRNKEVKTVIDLTE
jgi:hypothetical protein